MKLATALGAIGVLLSHSAALAADESVENAFALCQIVDSTGLASKPCEVSGWKKAVMATIDMNSGEARELCPQVAGLMRQKGRTFATGWTLQIQSPYSNGNSIAFCSL
jgi:hypothetical protein